MISQASADLHICQGKGKGCSISQYLSHGKATDGATVRRRREKTKNLEIATSSSQVGHKYKTYAICHYYCHMSYYDIRPRVLCMACMARMESEKSEAGAAEIILPSRPPAIDIHSSFILANGPMTPTVSARLMKPLIPSSSMLFSPLSCSTSYILTQYFAWHYFPIQPPTSEYAPALRSGRAFGPPSRWKTGGSSRLHLWT